MFFDKEENYMNNPTEWIIPGNPTKYDVERAFHELGKIDWNQSTNISVGDIVYIYVSKTRFAIEFKCRANKVDLKKMEIDDQEFNISGEYDGSYGRYMELELIEELKGKVYSRDELKKHGFLSPQSPIRIPAQVKEYLNLVHKLQHSNEMDPAKHDGSYELMKETIRAYKNKGDLGDCDYKDLNLVYLTCIGTWKQGLDAKCKTIDESHLSETEKARLKELLSTVWNKAINSEYSNHEVDKPNIGMFGTGFYTFRGKTDEDSPRNFIQMCIDILDMKDDEQIFNRCSQTLNDNFRGMRAASASVALHCLKPFTFPVFNGNMGADNIYVYLGIDINNIKDIDTYIKNCREVKKYRDENFKIKNYRIFDIAARDLGSSKEHTNIDYLCVLDYLDNNREVSYSNPEALGLSSSEKDRLLEIKTKAQAAVAEMKKMVKVCSDEFGLDKCESMSWLDGSNTKTRKYLWAQMKYNRLADSPISISIFAEISPLLNKARYRFSLEIKNDGTDKKQMDKYHSFLDMSLNSESSLVYVVGSNEIGKIDTLDETANVIKQKIDSGIYKKVQLCRIEEWTEDSTNDDFEAAMIEGISELIPYYKYVNDDFPITYWPSLDEYNPCITTEKWIELLNDSEVTLDANLVMFKMMLELGGESTCANLANKYGGYYGTYNVLGTGFGKRVHKKTKCPLCINNNHQKFYTIPFVGRYVEEDGKRRYLWKLRNELKEALKSMDLSKIDINSPLKSMEEFDKNMILYGPPGTGKTYNSAMYAVAICDGKQVDELTDYDSVMDRYNELKKEGRIAFTTFHQSYGYEEFIEGISPIIVSDDNSFQKDNIGYKYKDGSFKLFCNSAQKRTVQNSDNNTNVKDNARVWSVLLGGTGDTELKRLCFDENSIRIGWDELPEIITNDTEGLTNIEHRILLNFQDEMEIGDVVVSQFTNESIDAIGIITGEYEFAALQNIKYPRKRKVKWIVKGINEDIVSLNGGFQLDRKTVYPLNRINVNDILALADKFIDTTNLIIEKETRPYVFIIDEINRGNVSKIFGELITLIEDTKREGMPEAASAILPYSGDNFSVPKNVYILGTMNTADRSIALIDTALRRRFSFIEMMPESDVLRKIGADKVGDLDVADMLDTINERISFLYDREHTIGHAFFTSLKDDPTVERLQSIFEKSVIPLLQEYFYEDYKKIQMVLGDNGKSDPSLKFIKDEKVIVKSIFKGNVEDIIELPEKKYSINKVAFSNIQSYIDIM